VIEGWRCAVCDAVVSIAEPFPWRCPNSSLADRHHVLHLVDTGSSAPLAPVVDDPNPFVRWGPALAWWSFARANGFSEAECTDLTREVAGDFAITPHGRSDELSTELGLEVWVKNETIDVAGSQKARHLVSILLHLRAAEELGMLQRRPPLAIASCGNAALAAATLARRVDWPIDVYVPEWMDDAFGDRLDELDARTTRCARRAGDPPGDPALHAFRVAVEAGAVPFSVQGPENALCLDGGRTLGWEIAEQSTAAAAPLDRLYVQVGGGAFAASVGRGIGSHVRLHAVQAEGCAPLARAWARAEHVAHPAAHWAELMTPWEQPASVADGILDDETYDWLAVFGAMRSSGGSPVVATEHQVESAHALAHRCGYCVSPTGSAGLAGLLAHRAELANGERVAVIMSGIQR
jgi:threonine synthase